MKRSTLQTVVLGTLVCCTTQAADKHEMLLSVTAPKSDLQDEAGRTSYDAQKQSAGSLLRQVAISQQQDVQDREIDEIRPSLDYAWGDVDQSTLPENFTVNTDDEPMERVIDSPLLLHWRASSLWYHPMYFEDGPLERYGHTYDASVQNVISPAKFLVKTAMLPYSMTLRPPCSREYPLGWYRPGEIAPYLKYKPAFNGEAVAKEALAVSSLFFLAP